MGYSPLKSSILQLRSLFVILSLMVAISSTTLNAQIIRDTTVARVYGAQVGLIGIWAYGEFPIHDDIVLRTDVGLDASIRGGSQFYKPVFLLTPPFRVEPRWYYNYGKRAARGRRTDANAANYFSLPLTFYPAWFSIANTESIRVDPGLQLLPTYGIRRNLGDHLRYEIGIGMGYGIKWREGRDKLTGGSTAWLRLRIGL
jgi:hypothetical protein